MFKVTTLLLVLISGSTSNFHLTILVGMLFFNFRPLEFLWGGRMKTLDELLVFEMMSKLMVILTSAIVLIHSGKLNMPKLNKAPIIALWIFFLIFILNTFGNIIAPSVIEKSVSVIKAILAFLS